MKKTSKYIFLDFDGVLHKKNANFKDFFDKANKFDKLIETYKVDIVVTSGWQFDKEYNNLLKKIPNNIRKKIVGKTSDAKSNQKKLLKDENDRVAEIKRYIHELKLGKIDWIALDDSRDKFPEDFPKLIYCKPKEGLDKRQIRLIEIWLNMPNS
ncbi:MAG: domain in Swiss Army Knife repair protein [Pseudomonadota bacterium]